MYNIKYRRYGSEITKTHLTGKELQALTRRLEGIHNIKAFNNVTNETTRVWVSKYKTYYNKCTDLWFEEDDFVKYQDNIVNGIVYNYIPAALLEFKLVKYHLPRRFFRPRAAISPLGTKYRFEYTSPDVIKNDVFKVHVATEDGWSTIWTRSGVYLENYYTAITNYEKIMQKKKDDKTQKFLEYKESIIKKYGYYAYDAEQQKILILNEVKGITDIYTHITKEFNPSRAYNQQTAMSLDTNTCMQKATIITSYHTFTQSLVDCSVELKRTTQKKTKTFIKSSKAITLAQNLYNIGCPEIKLCDVRYIDGEPVSKSVIITQGDDLWNKIQDFCDLWNQGDSKIAAQIENDIALESTSAEFRKYASVYGLDPSNPEDEEAYLYITGNPEITTDFIDGSQFICPDCGEVVHVNSHYEYILGRYTNTYRTICSCCGKEYNIHDKQDILDMLASR